MFGLVIVGYGVKMIGLERLVVLSSKVQVLLFVQVHRVAIHLHRVAILVPRVASRGQNVFTRRDTLSSRRDPCLDRVAILPTRVASFSSDLVRNFFV